MSNLDGFAGKCIANFSLSFLDGVDIFSSKFSVAPLFSFCPVVRCLPSEE